VARPLNTLPKYVASTTLAEPLEWENSSLLRGDVPQAVRGLKEDEGKDLHVMTTGAIITTYAPAGERSSRRS
jgi:dihydrofolate reductase